MYLLEQRSLKVIDTNKTFFSKLSSTLTKMLIPTKVGFNNVMITFKRNALLKVYNEYKTEQNIEESSKKEALRKLCLVFRRNRQINYGYSL